MLDIEAEAIAVCSQCPLVFAESHQT